MLIRRLIVAAARVSLTCVSCVYAEQLEARATSWNNNSASFVPGSTTSHAGKVTGGEYVNGMWSYNSMNYTLQNPTQSVPTDFSDLTLATMTYTTSNAWGSVFCPNPSNQWSMPIVTPEFAANYWSYMAGNNYGTAISLNNVFAKNVDVTVDGSYEVRCNSWQAGIWIDSWILKVGTTGDITVLFQNHTQTSNPYAVTIDVDNIATTLEAGESLLVAFGGRYQADTDNFTLADGGLTWNVVAVPEPATMVLLALGGLVGLKRRK